LEGRKHGASRDGRAATERRLLIDTASIYDLT
jgi:hypothetical protein